MTDRGQSDGSVGVTPRLSFVLAASCDIPVLRSESTGPPARSSVSFAYPRYPRCPLGGPEPFYERIVQYQRLLIAHY